MPTEKRQPEKCDVVGCEGVASVRTLSNDPSRFDYRCKKHAGRFETCVASGAEVVQMFAERVDALEASVVELLRVAGKPVGNDTFHLEHYSGKASDFDCLVTAAVVLRNVLETEHAAGRSLGSVHIWRAAREFDILLHSVSGQQERRRDLETSTRG